MMAFKPTLLIIAAGMGSRYGGLKQIDPVGPNDEIIIDYSMVDAVRAGFKKVVFVIRHSFEEAFREKIASKLEGLVETAYAYQELDACLGDYDRPQDRQKPWGTGHAILVAKDVIDGPFAVINADDYYGPNAYAIIKQQLDGMATDAQSDYVMVGYVLRNTLSEYGAVARGVCQHSADMVLSSVTECVGIRKNADGAVYVDAQGGEQHLSGDEIVSMNLWGFAPDIFEHLSRQFDAFLKAHGRETESEFYIPTAVSSLVRSGKKKVRVLKTRDHWFGVTYREDKVMATSCIRQLIQQGVYPENLWQERPVVGDNQT